MTDWIVVTSIDGTKGLVNLDKIAYIDEGYEGGGAVIHIPGTRLGSVQVKETLSQIIERLESRY